MKYLALLLLLACGGKDPVAPPPVPPPPPLAEYRLQSLAYEDVYPAGGYAANLASWSGQATMGFGAGDGKLMVPSVVNGILHIVLPDSSTQDQAIAVLPQGAFVFTYTLDAGIVSFSKAPPLWPFPQGASLSDTLYSYDEKNCFNPECTDYIRLAFTWVRP